jgi:hypothetical protein
MGGAAGAGGRNAWRWLAATETARGLLMAEDAGAALLSEAEAWLTNETVVNVPRLASMIAPAASWPIER